jgi:hypothetical protein
MSWDVIVFGELTFPTAALSRWLSRRVDGSAYEDWRDGFDRGSREPTTVRQILDSLRVWSEGQDHYFIEVTVEGDLLRIRGRLAKPDFVAWRYALASAFRVAGKLAAGELQFVPAADGKRGWRVHVGAYGSRFERVELDGALAA